MKLHWGYYCIFLAIILCFIQTYIALNPTLDRSFTPIKIYNQPLYLTHNYVEMSGFFLFGIGFSKSLPKNTKFNYIIQAIMWLTLALYSVYKAVELSTSVLFTFLGALLVAFPLPLGFYLYKFYCARPLSKN